MEDNELNELITEATKGNLNSSFVTRLDDRGKQFISLLEEQMQEGKDVSPSVVARILNEKFGVRVDESTISKWKNRVKQSL
tara:strand:+ start:221 stop:463 length:243 start_codon:yes stop_codon:yes gene_type:complete